MLLGAILQGILSLILFPIWAIWLGILLGKMGVQRASQEHEFDNLIDNHNNGNNMANGQEFINECNIEKTPNIDDVENNIIGGSDNNMAVV